MKTLTLLLLLMMAAGFGAVSGGFSNHAAAASAARARTVQANGTEHRLNALDDKNRSNDKSFRLARPTTEAEAKRLKLMFLLMMSLGQYRTPIL